MIKNNAEVAAKIAAEMNDGTVGGNGNEKTGDKPLNETHATSTKANDPIVIGGSIVDLSYSATEDNLQVSQSFLSSIIHRSG